MTRFPSIVNEKEYSADGEQVVPSLERVESDYYNRSRGAQRSYRGRRGSSLVLVIEGLFSSNPAKHIQAEGFHDAQQYHLIALARLKRQIVSSTQDFH